MQFGYVTDVFEQQSFALHDYNMQKRTIIVSEVQTMYIQQTPRDVGSKYCNTIYGFIYYLSTKYCIENTRKNNILSGISNLGSGQI